MRDNRLKTVLAAIFLIAALALFVYTFSVLLIVFAGILLAILLRSLADFIHEHSRLSHGVCIFIVVAALTVTIIGNIWLFGVNFAGQVDQLKTSILKARDQVEGYAARYEWSRNLLVGARNGEAVFSRAPGAVSGFIRFVASCILMAMVGLYTAANPELYERAFIRLFPAPARPEVKETLVATASALRWWLAGQMVSMIVVGTLTTGGLWLLGVPLPFTLGFLTALLNFIPNVGAILSAVLAALLALTVSAPLAGYVLLLYVVIQAFEAYLLTPLIQQRAVELPPGLTITVQALMGVLVGGLGLALAAPLTVVGIVLTRKFHLKQDLGRRSAA
jgi:predicted PurR-regulated permease PerM